METQELEQKLEQEVEFLVIEDNIPIPSESFTNKNHKYDILLQLEKKQSVVFPNSRLVSVKQAITRFKKENNVSDRNFVCSEVVVDTKGTKAIRVWRTG